MLRVSWEGRVGVNTLTRTKCIVSYSGAGKINNGAIIKVQLSSEKQAISPAAAPTILWETVQGGVKTDYQNGFVFVKARPESTVQGLPWTCVHRALF